VGSGGIRSDSEHGAWNGNSGLDGKHDGQILRWDRAIGSGFSMAASVELSDDADGLPGGDTMDPILGLGGQFAMPMGAGTVALGGGFQAGSWDHAIRAGDDIDADTKGYQGLVVWGTNAGPLLRGVLAPVGTDSDGNDVTKGLKTVKGREVEGTIVGGSASFAFGNGLSAILNASVMEADGRYTDADADVTSSADIESTHLGVGFGYTVGAVSIGVNVGSKTTESSVDPNIERNETTDAHYMIDETVTGVGLDVAYDLGGGASLMFGVGSSETEYDYTYRGALSGFSDGENTHDRTKDANSWSLGVKFAF
ncbi:MAG: hypothetical protein OXD36_11630, partial [Rhodobacter sp.]|nr:hypothetical protein [Rhodobacter sp.]